MILAWRWRSLFLALVVLAARLAGAGGSISGVLKDPTGAVIPGAQLTLVNTALKAEFNAASDAQGFYSFPASRWATTI